MSGFLAGGQNAILAANALAAAAGTLLACGLVVALHALSPEYDPITRAMSDYANGRHGRLMLFSFLGLAASFLALAGAGHTIAVSVVHEAGAFLAFGAGVATLVAGACPIDATRDGRAVTTRGRIHAVAGFALSPLAVGAMLCLSWPADQAAGDPVRDLAIMGFAVLTSGAWLILLIVNRLRLRAGGLGQRIFMSLVCCWIVLYSVRLYLFATANP